MGEKYKSIIFGVFCISVLSFLMYMPIAAQDTVWTQSFGGTVNDFLFAVEPTSDGEFISTGAYDDGPSEVYLVKFDAQGDTAWTKTIGPAGRNIGLAVRQVSDGGFIIAGYYDYGAASDGYLIKTDQDGGVEWETTAGEYRTIRFRDVLETSEGSFMIGGYAFDNDMNTFARLVRYDRYGDIDILHQPMPSYLTEWYLRRIYSIVTSDDEGFIVSGFTTDIYDLWAVDLWISKTDSNMNLLWEKTYSLPDISGSWDISTTSDGGCIIAGYSGDMEYEQEDLWLVKTDGNGDTLWTNDFPSPGNDRIMAVKQTLDGGYILACTMGADDALYGGTGWLIKTDAAGDSLWSYKFFPESSDTSSVFYDVEQISETDYIVVGSVYPGTMEDSDVLITRISTAPQVYVCGDANGDGSVNVGDAVFLINFVFSGGPAPDPECTGEANGDGTLNVGDAVYLINYIFKGGPAPVEPCCR